MERYGCDIGVLGTGKSQSPYRERDKELKHNSKIVCNLRATGMFLLLNLCGARALGIGGWH